MSDEHVVIEPRFCGPADSGNGGYVCGRLAAFADGPAEVTLRRPPPLERPLAVERAGAGVTLLDGETLIAEAAPAEVELAVPDAVPPETAAAASRAYAGFKRHVFPHCFVCGPKREQDDGLRIFPGWIDGRKVAAAPWTPHRSLAAEDGGVRPEFIWAALDCPGAWALHDPRVKRTSVLGRLAARLLAPVRVGEPCVVVGWPLGEDGRKLYAGTALFGEGGDLRAFARATWIRID